MALIGFPGAALIKSKSRPSKATPTTTPPNQMDDNQVTGTIVDHIYRKANFSIFKLRTQHPLAKETNGILTVQGDTCLQVGNQIECEGKFVTHSKYGLQFKAEYIVPVIPDSDEDLIAYLKAGAVPGINSDMAKRLVESFGTDILNILSQNKPSLLANKGIHANVAVDVINAWRRQRSISTIMRQLKAYKLGNRDAWNIWHTWREKSIETIEANPYRLTNIKGIGFEKADRIAQAMGFKNGSEHRVSAALRHVMNEIEERGHTRISHSALVKKLGKTVGIAPQQVTAVLAGVSDKGYIARYREGQEVWYSSLSMFIREQEVAKHLKRLMTTPARYFGKPFVLPSDLKLADCQRDAVLMAPNSKVMVMTGGPGVGKTHTTRSILDVLEKQMGANIMLCAPTGRAAQRMNESTGREAATVHRTLNWGQNESGKWEFMFNAQNQLPCDVMVADEASMMDIRIFHALISALPDHASLILVGDIDQLPSVGPGAILKDLIDSERIPVTRLTEIFRTKKDDENSTNPKKRYLVTNAHRINQGEMPHIDNQNSRDFFFLKGPDTGIADKITQLVTESLPKTYGYHIDDIQILSPMRKGACGIHLINKQIQAVVNPNRGHELIRKENKKNPEAIFRPNDRVMMTRNSARHGIYNGDVGRVVQVGNGVVTVLFEDKEMNFKGVELNDLQHSWATTIHKSQGSEYPVIIIPCTKQHNHMLVRNLFYTGITRGKEMVILVGDPEALEVAVKNERNVTRHTGLATQIRYHVPELESAPHTGNTQPPEKTEATTMPSKRVNMR